MRIKEFEEKLAPGEDFTRPRVDRLQNWGRGGGGNPGRAR